MIEVIYKGEEQSETGYDSIKLPRNLRQIGECEHETRRVYVEDFVMTYIKNFSSRDLKYGALLGNIKRYRGDSYIFITGAISARPLLDNEIIFDEEVWTGIYEDIKTYFDDVEIVGWFASMPGVLPNDMPGLWKMHLDNFAGNDKVCFIVDRLENEDNFYCYEDGGMHKCGGYYIYYEKNVQMQSYMSMHIQKRELSSEYEQTRKSVINAKVHKILFKKLESEYENKEKLSGKTRNTVDMDITVIDNGENHNLRQSDSEKPASTRDIGVKENIDNSRRKRRFPAFAYSASSFMLIALLIGTIAVMNASGQLNDLKSVIAGINKTDSNKSKETESKNQQEETAKIVDVAGNVEPTTIPVTETELSIDNKTTAVNGQTQGIADTTANQGASSVEPVTEQQTTAPMENPTASVTDVPSETRFYTVKTGDSLYSISLRTYGSVNMIKSIMSANNMTNENLICEGDVIILP